MGLRIRQKAWKIIADRPSSKIIIKERINAKVAYCPKEDEVLCTYHLKAIRLWVCEENSLEWWNSTSVFAFCSECMKILAEWLISNYCPNYFIPDANLFHQILTFKIVETIEKQLYKFWNYEVL